MNETGFHAFGAYDGASEMVSLSNGNLNLTLPLLKFPGRSGMDFSLAVEYDSKFYSPSFTSLGQPQGQQLMYWGSDLRGPMITPDLRLAVPTLSWSQSYSYHIVLAPATRKYTRNCPAPASLLLVIGLPFIQFGHFFQLSGYRVNQDLWMPSCKTLALTILMIVHTPATTQEEPRVGEQNRQREVRQARHRPQRGLHPRPEADHLAVLIC
jgi:hypothetical protein